MMTIKEFALLCGCNAQTLRYYDKIDLLKPVKVDPWSGYRYYEASQAVDFVKIKNLQAADFSIDEIKALLTMHDQQVYEAFDRKILEQTEKLKRIREIQQSYLTEMNTMKNLINAFCDDLLERAKDPDMLREFGMDFGDASAIVDMVRSLMISRTLESGEEERKVTMVVDDKLFEGTQAMENMTYLLNEEDLNDTVYLNADNIRTETSDLTENMEPIWESHGWTFSHEFLDNIPVLEDGERYVIMLSHHQKIICGNLAYPMVLIGTLLLKGYNAADLHCFVEKSTDGANHITLLRRK